MIMKFQRLAPPNRNARRSRTLRGERMPFTFHKIDLFPGDALGLSSINAEVPTPDALVDLNVALAEWKLDLINVRDIYSWGARPSIEANWRILINHRDWCRFWS